MTPEERALRRDMIDVCLSMNRTGLNQGKAGNVSVRWREGLLITPTGIPYEDMTEADVVWMSLDGQCPDGQRLPSSEWHFHCCILRNRPEAGAVLHAHSPHATALACLRRGIPPFHYMIAVAGGSDIRCADYATFGTDTLSDSVLRALEGRLACLLANHGLIAIGRKLGAALALAWEVENLARQYLLALGAGEPVLLDDAEMAVVLEKFKTYGQQR